MGSLFQSIQDTLFTLISALYSWTQDWGLAVIAFAVLLRAVLFYLNLQQARQQVRQFRMQPHLRELRKRHEGDSDKLLQGMAELNRRFAIQPFAMLAVLLVQAPIFMNIYRMFAAHGSAMTSVLLPWAASLGQGDPLHIVPIVYALLSLANMLVPLLPDMAHTASLAQRLGLPLIMTVMIALFMWMSPVAVGLYWITNVALSLAERLLYRTRFGYKLLHDGLPDQQGI